MLSKSQKPAFQRLVQIAYEHISLARRNPAKLAEIAKRMGIPEEIALAAAIADQVIEEFNVSQKGPRPCLKL